MGEPLQVNSVSDKILGLITVNKMPRADPALAASGAASAIVSIVEPARYPLIARDYPEMAT